MTCPLCHHDRAKPSWLGATVYDGQTYRYLQCLACRSLYCHPMPNADTLARMYGPQYETSFGDDPNTDDPKDPGRVVALLAELPCGTFIDYGCGAGSLLAEAVRLNWRATGVEFDPRVARAAEQRSGAPVVTRPNELRGRLADVLHLGDVIEHLTDLDHQLPAILGLIKPGGLLLAQGPLEANANLFTSVLRLSRRLRGSPPVDMAPYHVLLATAKGQKTLFQKLGLEEVAFSVREVAWPAPSHLALADLRCFRSVVMFSLRRCSQIVSTLMPGRWGNRYFYVGHTATRTTQHVRKERCQTIQA